MTAETVWLVPADWGSAHVLKSNVRPAVTLCGLWVRDRPLLLAMAADQCAMCADRVARRNQSTSDG